MPEYAARLRAGAIIGGVRIALVAPPLLSIPPVRYGGVERIVAVLADALHRRGQEVTLFAPGDSVFAGNLVVTVPRGLWSDGFHPDPSAHYQHTLELVLHRAGQFDVIHSHLDQHGFALAGAAASAVVATLHGRTDTDPLAGALRANRHVPVIAVSNSQRSFVPEANWIATIYHGLPLESSPTGDGGGDYLLFVGRLSSDKGVAEAVQAARLAGRRLVIAAKALAPNEIEVYERTVVPAVREGVVEFVGEVERAQRDDLFAAAEATIMLSRWPEPFGLVAIESLATGTPVIAARSGALPEIVEHGVDGFIVDDPDGAAAALAGVNGLDRSLIRRRALERFSEERMVDEYEEIYTRVAAPSQGAHSNPV